MKNVQRTVVFHFWVCLYFSKRMDEELLAVIDMLSAGKVDVCSLITQRFSIDQLDKALSFWDASPAKVTKIMISF